VLLAKTLRSSTFRLAVVCIAVFYGSVFALLGYVYWATTNYVRSRCDRAIAADRALLVQAYGQAGRRALVTLIDQRIAWQSVDAGIYLLVDPSMAVLAGTLNRWPGALHAARGWADFEAPEAAGFRRLRVTYETLLDGSHLLVGRSLDDLDQFVGVIETALAVGATLTFALAVFSGVSVTRRSVGRIETINDTTRAIMQSGLGKRIPLRGTKDEWDQLAENLNAMLDRIEGLMREVRHVSDNVAHDLRTPLTRLRGRLEKASHQEFDPERSRALVADTMRELDVVLTIFSSLLRISRIEGLNSRGTFSVVDLAQVAGEVAELFDAAAEAKGRRVKFESGGRVRVIGDRDLLFDAISNLIDNAVTHGGGDVQVTVRDDDQGPTVSVADRGPGIPLEERKHVLKRFYRIERSRSSPGHGLGLSLVAAVVQLHRARLEMEDNGPGLKIWLQFQPVITEGSLSVAPEASGTRC
jgi:signal transduction histidine kinase